MAWTYEQKFNALTTGDLNGQDSWTADVSWDVSTTSPYEGANCIQRQCEGDAPSGIDNYKPAYRTITAVTDGSMYFAFKYDSSSAAVRAALTLEEGTTSKCYLLVVSSFSKLMLFSGGSFYDIATGLSSGTWYPVNMEFDCGTDQYRARVYSSGAWGSFSTWYAMPSTATQINNLNFGSDKGAAGTGGMIYLDTFTPTDPTAPAASSGRVANSNRVTAANRVSKTGTVSATGRVAAF
jgi:hypothetical protein